MCYSNAAGEEEDGTVGAEAADAAIGSFEECSQDYCVSW